MWIGQQWDGALLAAWALKDMPAYSQVDERTLLSQAQAGDVDAFGELYERNAARVYRFLLAHLGNHQDAEDLTADVFYRTWRSLPTFHERGVPFQAFLLKIARNALVDHYRRSSVVAFASLEESEDVIPGAATQPVDVVLSHLESQYLHHVLDRLRPDYRLVLALRFISDLSPEETARVMQRSVGAVRVLQHRALSALRILLNLDDQ